ncbi:18641_t:CDS:2 [Acaulospora morrowiae]|uniref:18641_t:CDS:1 n=1 Tax=Acaulospora morrowiae TaxID=94023 RepID=A0A9N9F732_9GLOM|nr:18641_t:CDS:2 [Acaulospora morrowiae]
MGRFLPSSHQSYPLPPEFGQPSNSETLGEIIGRTVRLRKIYKRNWANILSAKLESLFKTARQVKITVAHSENYSTKSTNEPNTDIGVLKSAFHRPQWMWMYYYSEAQSIPSLFRMATGLGESVIKNHAFLDGNKRAGHLAISLFLAVNDYDLVADDASTEKITIGVATGDVNIDILESWITSNAKKRE